MRENLLEDSCPLSSRKSHCMEVMLKIQRGLAPGYLMDACPPFTKIELIMILRNGINTEPQPKTTSCQKLKSKSVKDWNGLGWIFRVSDSIIKCDELQQTLSGYKVNHLYHINLTNYADINYTRMHLGLNGLNSQR